uniref:Sodium/potassium/calcium exchanger 1 n=1 Tax=Monodelphis domestica TaxID=13616 RepID=F6VVA1_MONDO
MGKLIKFGGKEKRLSRRKRLQWNRVLFLLGMVLIGSTYQLLKTHQALPTLWTTMHSQHPLKMASRDLPDSEMVTLNGDHQESSLEMEGSTLDPEDRDKLTPSALVVKKNLNMPGRIVNNYTPVTPVTPRRKKKNYTLTTGKQIVKNYTPTTFSRNVQDPTSTTPKRIESYMIIPNSTAKINDMMKTLKTVDKKFLTIPKRTEENTLRTPQGIIENTPTILKRIIEKTKTPTTPKRLLENTSTVHKRAVEKNSLTTTNGLFEKNTPTTPKRAEEDTLTIPNGLVEDTPTTPKGAEEKNTPTTLKRTVHQTMMKTSTMVPRTTVENNAAPGFHVVSTPTKARELTSKTSSTKGMIKRTSTAIPNIGVHNMTSSTMDVNTFTNQIRHCVFVEPISTVSANLSPSTGLTPFLDETSHSSPSPTPNLLDFHSMADYPPDLFSVEQRRQGWVILHIFGMIYVFVALAIVCDEYFVPALGAITNKLQISEDVAGATFMAAGGSAPELFTSLIGVFISHSNVGIGTIVGSAVFNILFVIGTCALFSREILNLTWWPLFRDVSFYIFDLMILIIFFLDSLINWWESLLLLMAYAFYVFTMKWNRQLEGWVKEQLNKRTIAKIMVGTGLSKTSNGDITADAVEDSKKMKLPSILIRGSNAASLHNSTIRSTIYQLMLHTQEPLREERIETKEVNSLGWGLEKGLGEEPATSIEEPAEPDELPAVKVSPASAVDTAKDQDEPTPGGQKVTEHIVTLLHVPASIALSSPSQYFQRILGSLLSSPDQTNSEGSDSGADDKDEDENEGEGDAEGETKDLEEAENQAVENSEGEAQGETKDEGEPNDEDGTQGDSNTEAETKGLEEVGSEAVENIKDEIQGKGEGETQGPGPGPEEEPLSLEWPETRSKQAIYLFLLPIVFPLWLTVPDVRKPESRKFFVITFLGSILWIAMFSYLMVWWAHQVGETIGISEEIMGLTILAAGTSIPDLITSVIVARKGLGDMAVSSSVGSNIFDITVGLPVPWLLFSVFNELQPVPVSSNGLFCAIVLLLLMLLFVISSIAFCKWRMNKILGFTMFLLYFIFLIISVMLEDRIISCPISI